MVLNRRSIGLAVALAVVLTGVWRFEASRRRAIAEEAFAFLLPGIQVDIPAGMSDAAARDYVLKSAAQQDARFAKRMQRLLDNGVDPNSVDAQVGWTLLSGAVSNGLSRTARLLLDAGAEVNQYGADGWTPLMCAANIGDLEMVKHLHGQGADLHLRSREPSLPVGAQGKTALEIALAALARNEPRSYGKARLRQVIHVLWEAERRTAAGP